MQIKLDHIELQKKKKKRFIEVDDFKSQVGGTRNEPNELAPTN